MQRQNAASAGSLVRAFYIRRFFRIFPLSTFAILAAVILGVTTLGPVHGLTVTPMPPAFTVLSDLLMLQNVTQTPSIINVLWSLPYEVQMYLLLPFIFLWVRSRQGIFWSSLGLWVFSVVAAEIQPQVPVLSRALILRFLPNFLPGILAFVVASSLAPERRRLKSFLWPVFILVLIGVFTQTAGFRSGWVLCLILGLALPRFAEIRNRPVCAISRSIATYSYGIYLTHPFAIWIAYGAMASFPVWLRVAVLLCLLISLPVALYHLLELPMIHLGTRLAAPRAMLRSRAAAAD